MSTQSPSTRDNGRLIGGGLLLFFGVMALLAQFVTFTSTTWIILLAVSGVLATSFYFVEPNRHPAALIPSYVLLAVASLIFLVTREILDDGRIATYVLSVVAFPFIVTFITNIKQNWWALIPAWVLSVIGTMIWLLESGAFSGDLVPTYVLSAIALPFVVVYFFNPRENWWALIPAWALGTIAVMVGLIIAGALTDLLIPTYVMFAIAIPFMLVFVKNRENWWALIPGGITAAIGFAFLVSVKLVQYAVPIFLIAAGALILLTQNRSKPQAAQPISGPASDVAPEPVVEDKPLG